MITVQQAEQIILQQVKGYGIEAIPFGDAMGHVLVQDIVADRDLPPCDRATMDGIAIRYTAFEQGLRSFSIKATIAAGDIPIDIGQDNECVELMTGAGIPSSVDTVIRYEDIQINDSHATITIDTIKKGQNVHLKGKDKTQGDILLSAGTYADASIINVAATVGQNMLQVKRLPKVAVISTGNELVAVDQQPTPYQVRMSNSHTIRAILQQQHVTTDILHIADDLTATKDKIQQCLGAYDVLILSGGVSMGKFDHVPQALAELGVEQLFHKVQQRPGKPFWFGRHDNGVSVFAFPGNPVSAFMCMYRYFLPWLQVSLGVATKKVYAVLSDDVTFTPMLQYFLQVNVTISNEGQLMASPIAGNGSGDLANLLSANAFMELPMEQSAFKQGERYRIWPYKHIV